MERKKKIVDIFQKVDLNQEQIIESLSKNSKEILDLLVTKNKEYGSASFRTGLAGNMCRLTDKIDRYQALIKKLNNGDKIVHEGIHDTLKDIVGYGLIGLVILGEMEK